MTDTSNDAGNPSGPTRTHQEVRAATQELLKYGLLEEDRKPNLYRTARVFIEEINRLLEPLDFELHLDEVRGLMFVTMLQSEAGNDEAEQDQPHPLIRRQRLNMEQSLLVAQLRQYFMAHEQENGIGTGNARVAVEELVAALQVYLPATGSETRDEKRVRSLLESLRGHNIVTEIDEHDRVGIRPLISHIADPASLTHLVEHYRALASGEPGKDP